jgi:hypothetical protein
VVKSAVSPDLSLDQVYEGLPTEDKNLLNQLGIRFDSQSNILGNWIPSSVLPNAGQLQNPTSASPPRPSGASRSRQLVKPQPLELAKAEELMIQMKKDFAPVLSELQNNHQDDGFFWTEYLLSLIERASAEGAIPFPVEYHLEDKRRTYIILSRIAIQHFQDTDPILRSQLDVWKRIAQRNGATDSELEVLANDLRDFQAELVGRVVTHPFSSKSRVDLPMWQRSPAFRKLLESDLEFQSKSLQYSRVFNLKRPSEICPRVMGVVGGNQSPISNPAGLK